MGRTVKHRYGRVGEAENHAADPSISFELRTPHKICVAVAFLATLLLFVLHDKNAPESLIIGNSLLGETQLLMKTNLQLREDANLASLSRGYTFVNAANVARRRQNMKELDMVRLAYCGDMGTGKWRVKDKIPGFYIRNSSEYAMMGYLSRRKDPAASEWLNRRHVSVMRRVCKGEHPRLSNTYVLTERIGPLKSHGGYDWNSFSSSTGFEEETKGKVMYVVGKMFAPIHANGSIIDYPPLHIHHAHVYPFKHDEMNLRNVPKAVREDPIYKSWGSHHVLLQAHGDSACKADEGGTDCLLAQLRDDRGYRIVNSSGFETNFEINDVRPAMSEELEFFVDITHVYTYEARIPTTFLQIGAPILGQGWQTYYFPLDGHTNMMYFKFKNTFLGAGELSDFILHTHMTFLDSLYIFKGQHAFEALQDFRKMNTGSLPYVFECHKQDFEATSKKLLASISSKAELICEATKPGLRMVCDPLNGSDCALRDRRVNLLCKTRARLEADDVLVLLAFNRVRRTSTSPMISRHSTIEELSPITPFGMGFAGHQHTIFRADFVSDKARSHRLGPGTGNIDKDLESGSYAPPAIFVTASLPPGVDTRKMLDHCAANFSFNVDLPWNDNVV